MLSFYSSTPIYSGHRLAYPDEALTYSSYFPRVNDPRTRYRRALAEYIAAEDEYNAALRAREEAVLRARVKAIRQEQARLFQARQLEHALARTRTAQLLAADDDLSRPLLVPVVCSPPKQCAASVPDVPASHVDGAGFWKELFGSPLDSAHQPEPPVEGKAQPDHNANENEAPTPTLGSLLRDRLQSTADDEEVQDVARTLLRHLDEQPTSMTGVTEPSPAACPSEVRIYTARPSEGADLSRSDALQGAAAEAAKASFKAHRTETAEDSSSPVSPVSKTSSSSFQTIQDIRAGLTKLSANFSLPSSLEFSDDEEDGLAYSPINAPVRSYEHALDDLLVQLDAVESDGDEEVRELRRSAVKEVEKAIEDVERRVREARQEVAPLATSGTSTQDDEVVGKPVSESESAATVDDGKPQEAGPSQPQSGDCEDEACHCSRSSSVVSFSVPDIQVVSPDDVNMSLEPDIVAPPTPSLAAEAEFSCDDDVSESIDEEATGASPERSPAATPAAESPAEFATPIVGAIAPSSTPVRPSSVSPEEGLSTPLKFEGDDDEWTEV